MPKVYLGSRYHSSVNHVDVKTTDKRLAQGVLVLSREKLTQSMIKHLELQSSENCLASGRAFETPMIDLEFVFIAQDCFHDLSCLFFDFYWICSIIAVEIIYLLRCSLFPFLTYTLVLVIPGRYFYLSVHFLHNRLNGSSFLRYFEFLSSDFPLVLFIVQFLLAMNYDTFVKPQLLLLVFAFQVLSCILYNLTY